MTERLFFALWPGSAQRQALEQVKRELPRHGGRETHPDDLHVTLVFLGDVEPQMRSCAERVAEQAADRVRAAPCGLTLDRIGCFPRPRILWCGASERQPPLLDLVGALNQALPGCGFVPERRPFAPHVTLVRNACPLPVRDLERPIVWPMEEFALVVTESGAPPRYRVLRRWPLTREAGAEGP